MIQVLIDDITALLPHWTQDTYVPSAAHDAMQGTIHEYMCTNDDSALHQSTGARALHARHTCSRNTSVTVRAVACTMYRDHTDAAVTFAMPGNDRNVAPQCATLGLSHAGTRPFGQAQCGWRFSHTQHRQR